MTDSTSAFDRIEENQDLRQALTNTQRKLARALKRNETLVAATKQAVLEAMVTLGPLMPPPRPPRDRRSSAKEEVALWHLTDWQGGKRTNTYNSDVMRERVMRFCERAVALTEIQRAHHPVRRCVIMFGGDLIEGLFNFPSQVFEIDATLFLQFVHAVRLVVEVVLYALAHYDEVEIIGEWGNHGRIGSKRAAVPPSDNFDRMILWTAREILRVSGQKRVTWLDSQVDTMDIEWEEGKFLQADIQRVEIGNYRALLIHGDEIGRNGYASPMTIVNHVAKWKSGSYPWKFRDAYGGHYHNHNEWQLPDGEGSYYQTGSPEDDNRYAGVHMASAASPTQRLHFIDPVKGRVTAQYKVYVRDGDE